MSVSDLTVIIKVDPRKVKSMSRIYFRSEDGTAQLRGSERAHMGILCSQLLLASIMPIWDTKDSPSWLRRVVPPGHYSLMVGNFENTIETWLRAGFENFVVKGQAISIFSVALNTAMLIGNDTIKLCARLHGQCEIHCFVEGPNRAWLADLMEQGRKQYILRADEGWESVIEFLRARDDIPVVTSYSVTDGFPNAGLAIDAGLWSPPKEDAEDWDEFYQLPSTEQWRMCMEALRTKRGNLELKPEGWQEYYFDEGITGFTLPELANT